MGVSAADRRLRSGGAEVERLIIGHDIRHNGNPIATWQIGNAKAYTNANGDKRLVKQKHGDYRKVDVPQSMLMSLKDAVTGLEDVPIFTTIMTLNWYR